MRHKTPEDTRNHASWPCENNQPRTELDKMCETEDCNNEASVKCCYCGRYFCSEHIREHMLDTHGEHLS